MSARLVLTVGLLVVLPPSSASASASATKTHVVRAGESMTAISKRYYGHFDHAGVLMLSNGKASPRLQIGETLRIPLSVEHEVRPGDTWSGICRARLGRASVYPAVAALNGRDPTEPLKVGDTIVVPARVPYRLKRGDSLSALAERYLGSPELADALQLFNEIEDPRRLSVGQRLELPMLSLRPVEPSKPESADDQDVPAGTMRDESSTPRRGARPTDATRERAAADAQRAVEPSALEGRLEAALEAALEAYRRGEFRSALEMLEALRAEKIEASPEGRARLWTQLTFAYAAFDRPDDVCDAWSRLSPAEASRALRDRLASPKIARMVRGCGDATAKVDLD